MNGQSLIVPLNCRMQYAMSILMSRDKELNKSKSKEIIVTGKKYIITVDLIVRYVTRKTEGLSIPCYQVVVWKKQQGTIGGNSACLF